MTIIIDFDGTCVTHDYPKIGKDIGAQPVLKALVENGHKLILFTMRSFGKDNTLGEARDWFKENDIPLYGVQTNPTQHTWTSSPKAYGQLIIDDAALGCPLIDYKEYHDRPYVDWRKVNIFLFEMGLYDLNVYDTLFCDSIHIQASKGFIKHL